MQVETAVSAIALPAVEWKAYDIEYNVYCWGQNISVQLESANYGCDVSERDQVKDPGRWNSGTLQSGFWDVN